ncbi:hypothetical protein B0J14DRAFT_698383 [Halenospora varia]|nr:hypothetical protein B0J14DRAFT_698383 [Halenospora varia]
MTHENGQAHTWKTPGGMHQVWNLSPMLAKDSVEVVTRLPRCRIKSDPLVVLISDSENPSAVEANYELCPAVAAITLQNGIQNVVLEVEKIVQLDDGSTVTDLIGRRGISYPNEFVELPSYMFDLDTRGPVTRIRISQIKCDMQSGWTTIPLTKPRDRYDPPKIASELYECGMGIPITHVDVDSALVQAFDPQDPISDPQILRTGTVSHFIRAWSRLKVGEVWVVQTGCNADGKTRGEVQKLPDVTPAPKIQKHLRPHTIVLKVKRFMAGAQAYALVNGKRASETVKLWTEPTYITLYQDPQHK